MLLTVPYELPYSIPEFPLELRTIQDYQSLVKNTLIILNDRMLRIERLLDDGDFVEDIEDDLRSARGKIMIITKNNLKTFDRLIKEARNDKQGIADLTGFWSVILPELKDVEKACAKVEKHRINRGRLSISMSSPRTPQKQTTKSQIPAPRPTPSALNSNQQAIKKPTPSRSTPGLRKFLASKRLENANQVLTENNRQI